MPYDDYPQSATNNAKRALKWADENGWGSCGTPVGKQRANQLANRETISEETVKRTYSFLSRHAENADVPYDEGCGGLMYDAWGGKSMLSWAESKVNQMKEEKQESIVRKHYGDDVELRTMEMRAADDEVLMVEGYAAVFDQETNLGYFKEKIARGAFSNVMEDDVRLLLNHDGAPLARTTNGTLELSTDDNGLHYRAVLNDTTQGRDLYKMIKRGDITQSSFAFTIKGEEWDKETNLRTVTEVGRLLDVSPVTYPAYPQASVSARSKFEAETEAAKAPEVNESVAEAREEVTPSVDTKNVSQEVRKLPPNLNTMNINDLKGQRAAYYEEYVEIGKHIEAEGRSMTEAEQERSDKLVDLMKDIDAKIKYKQNEQEMLKRMAHTGVSSTSEQESVNAVNYKFSLSRAIKSIANQERLEGAEAEWTQEAHREMRSSGITPNGKLAIPTVAFRAGAADNFQATSGDGSGFVATNVPFAIEALRAPSVIQGLGATVINAQGNLKFPRISVAGSVTEELEVDTNTGAGLELDELTLTPRRLSAKTTYSQQLIYQGGAEVDRLIANDISADMNTKIDSDAFSAILAGAASDLTTAGTGTASATTFDADLAFRMEAAVLAAGGDLSGAAYVMSPHAYKISKSLAAVSSVSALFDGGQFNGYRPVATKHLADITADTIGQMIFGNFSQGLILAFFSGVDILVDPFSSASNAQITLHVNRYFDTGVRQAGAFSVCSDVV